LEELFEGVKKFTSVHFDEYKNLFNQLSRKQKPHTLFIGCSDSRVVPNLITSTMPGELFIIRNIANIIPKNRESKDFLATTSAIEYAVKVLEVSNIIVCGHSNCGGCNAFYLPEETLAKTPHTKKWIQCSSAVIEKIKKDKETMNDPIKREIATEQMNIVEQINHLLSYPDIEKKYKNNELNIFGWYYIIETGEIYNYNKDKHIFEIIE